ncbi:phosphotransferase family protein [Aestuariivirga sp.]|uniref:phosphotransferase family protein n=1 Tax=Aestuariivirga sp. TaxID=2650926 RepID=UPI00391B00B8
MNMAADSELETIDDRTAREMAKAVADHHWGKKVKQVKPLGGGLTNLVFEVDASGGPYIIRIGKHPSKVKDFLKEQWAISQAHDAGVPVPEVLEVGAEFVPAPYMISRSVAGVEGTKVEDPLPILEEMGRLTSLIHTVATSGFGHTFDWSSNKLSRKETWSEFLKRELRLEERLGVLQKHKMLSQKQGEGRKQALREIEDWSSAPVLNHGDMRLKNVILDGKSGKIKAILDWEFCCSNIAPHWDLSLALHDLSIDAKQSFISGYGLKEKDILKMAPILKALNVINYAPYVANAAEQGDKERLAQYRIRFSGALDLYSL